MLLRNEGDEELAKTWMAQHKVFLPTRQVDDGHNSHNNDMSNTTAATMTQETEKCSLFEEHAKELGPRQQQLK